MSGIYLTVWDFQHKENSPVLKSTQGGHPHITVVWSGKPLTQDQLIVIGTQCLQRWLRKDIAITRAYVSSFEKNGVERHDVLLEVNMDLQATRDEFITSAYPDLANQLVMRKPHITHGTCYASKEEAERIAADLNEKWLPYHSVKVNGLSI